MITNFLKSAYRSIIRHKLFSSINIIGFAASMSIGLLLISILYDVSSYDSFHKNRDHIYRVTSKSTDSENNVVHLATTSIKAGRMIREAMPEIEDLVIVRNGFSGDFRFGDKTIQINDACGQNNPS